MPQTKDKSSPSPSTLSPARPPNSAHATISIAATLYSTSTTTTTTAASLRQGAQINPHRFPSLSSSLPYAPLESLTMSPGLHAPVPILPRAGLAARPGSRACELCGRPHDATFGAGRFCSSRCARTVGGLAHRRKREAERRAAAAACATYASVSPARVTSTSSSGGVSAWKLAPLRRSPAVKKVPPPERMRISSLLNPE